MKLVSVDDVSNAPNNVRMTREERLRIGLKLKALRVESTLDQVELAAKAKVSVGTLQAIEGAWYEVKDSNIEKVAKFFGTSLGKLLTAQEPVQPTDPLLVGLNREDLLIARAYHDASSDVRRRAALTLQDPEAAAPPEDLKQRAATLAARVAGYGPAALEQLEDLAAELKPKTVPRAREK